MNQEATQKSKDVQTGSEVVEALLNGKPEQYKEFLEKYMTYLESKQ